MDNKQLDLIEQQMDKLQQNVKKAKDKFALAEAELSGFRKRHAELLELIEENAKKRKIDARKREMLEIAQLLIARHNMNNNNAGNGGNSTTKQNGNVVWMPLELHCEWFAWLPVFIQRQLIPELCRGIYAIKGKEVKRKLERLNKWQHWNNEYLKVSADRRTVKCINAKGKWATIRAEHPCTVQLSSQCQMRGHRICYFEVKIVVCKDYPWISIGLCDGNFPLFGVWGVGGKANSFAISSYGHVWMENVNLKGNSNWKFGQGDVFGCGLEIVAAVDDGQKMHVFFTKNGTICGNPFQLPASAYGVELFPAVTLREYGSQIEANFGHAPFMYDLAKHNSTQQQ